MNVVATIALALALGGNPVSKFYENVLSEIKNAETKEYAEALVLFVSWDDAPKDIKRKVLYYVHQMPVDEKRMKKMEVHLGWRKAWAD